VKALSVIQPWAWLIVNGFKDIENRGYPIKQRGWVYIHASKTILSKIDYNQALTVARGAGISIEVPASNQIERGGIVGAAEFVDCVQQSESPWFFGEYGLVIANAVAFDFVKCSGQLGFFSPSVSSPLPTIPPRSPPPVLPLDSPPPRPVLPLESIEAARRAVRVLASELNLPEDETKRRLWLYVQEHARAEIGGDFDASQITPQIIANAAKDLRSQTLGNQRAASALAASEAEAKEPKRPHSTCRSCNAPIRWQRTPTKNTPVNLDGQPHWATCPDRDKWRHKK